MDIERFRNYCLSLDGVAEDMPFGPDVLAFRVGGKIFALVNIDRFSYVNLKCDPEKSIELREQYSAIQPGYHMNKRHWISVGTKLGVPEELFFDLVRHSFELVRSGHPKRSSSRGGNR